MSYNPFPDRVRSKDDTDVDPRAEELAKDWQEFIGSVYDEQDLMWLMHAFQAYGDDRAKEASERMTPQTRAYGDRRAQIARERTVQRIISVLETGNLTGDHLITYVKGLAGVEE